MEALGETGVTRASPGSSASHLTGRENYSGDIKYLEISNDKKIHLDFEVKTEKSPGSRLLVSATSGSSRPALLTKTNTLRLPHTEPNYKIPTKMNIIAKIFLSLIVLITPSIPIDRLHLSNSNAPFTPGQERVVWTGAALQSVYRVVAARLGVITADRA